ncbi:MAG: polysaccharide deacetylase family protein [candidate division KSB1 bacterium]|nr:polysaccharide deacetylase family protein [candidate division KSB1 bacterium]
MQKALWLLPWMWAITCTRNPVVPSQTIPVEEEYRPEATVCYWRFDKKAAVTLSFDDARRSHWELAAPAMEARGFFGTFNLDTKGIRDWAPWNGLHEAGHEIASHTYSHARLPAIPPAEVELEVQRAVDQLKANIRGLEEVLSFAYPYADYTDELIPIVARYHLSQRAQRFRDERAIHLRPVDPQTLNCLKGFWICPPYDLELLRGVIDATVSSGGWLIVFWHSLTKDPSPSDPNTAPMAFFEGFLDLLTARSDSLWVATQGEIASYVWERDNLSPEVRVSKGRSALWVSLPKATRALAPVPLTIRVGLPDNWKRGHASIMLRSGGRKAPVVREGRLVELEVKPGEEITIWAQSP